MASHYGIRLAQKMGFPESFIEEVGPMYPSS
jgi:hypothetical protein